MITRLLRLICIIGCLGCGVALSGFAMDMLSGRPFRPINAQTLVICVPLLAWFIYLIIKPPGKKNR